MGLIIKGIFTNLTPAEKVYLVTHPHHITTIQGHADTAFAETGRRYPGAPAYNDEADAFRHCYWSALLARDLGSDNALAFTTAHEAYSANPPLEREMDLHNNAVGVGIGAGAPAGSNSDAQLANLVATAIVNGQLQTGLAAGGGAAYGY